VFLLVTAEMWAKTSPATQAKPCVSDGGNWRMLRLAPNRATSCRFPRGLRARNRTNQPRAAAPGRG
jgi:hypothetical protein